MINLILLTIFGFLLANLISDSVFIFEKICLGYLLGLGIVTFEMFLLGWLGIRLSETNIIILLIVSVLITVLLNVRLKRFSNNRLSWHLLTISKFPWYLKILPVFILILFIASLFFNIYWPVYDWDAIALYDFRGRVFAETGKLFSVLSLGNYYVGYPLLTSLAHAIVYLGGLSNPRFLYSLSYFAFILFFYFLLRRSTGEKIALISSAIVASWPQIFLHSTLTYTNLIYTIYFSLGVIYLFLWIKEKKQNNLLLSGLLIGLCIWTRVDEFWLAPLLFAIITLIYLRKIKLLVYYIALSLGMKTTWDMFLHFNFTSKPTLRSNIFAPIDIGTAVARIGGVLTYLYNYVIKPELVLYSIFLISLLFIRKKLSASNTIVIIVVADMVLLFGGAMWVSFTYPDWTSIGGSVTRLSIFFIPLIIFQTALVLNDRLIINKND